MTLNSDFQDQIWNSRIPGTDGSDWFKTIAEINMKMNLNPVIGNMGKNKNIYVNIFHHAVLS